MLNRSHFTLLHIRKQLNSMEILILKAREWQMILNVETTHDYSITMRKKKNSKEIEESIESLNRF